jgi:thiol-disulfide isomerase/thioredoxin
MTYRLSIFCLASLFFACSSNEKAKEKTLLTGLWRATLSIQDQEVPFHLEIEKDSSAGFDIFILNAQERLLLDEVSIEDDSIFIPLHIFDATIRAKISDHTLTGEFVKHYEKDYKVPFKAEHGKGYRFNTRKNTDEIKDFSGKYRVTFYEEDDTVSAVGLFNQYKDSVTGTFLTPTGDYRFLQGNVVQDTLQLSTFDGNYIYLFKAVRDDDQMLKGRFYSGKTKNISWIGIPDNHASLPDPESLTYLKKGYEKIEFTFPDVNGDSISLSDEKYRGKVVILQLFGTWCPNCMDETKFLSPWYDKNKSRGIEIIGLAYERKDDFGYASTRVKKMIDKMKVKYDFVIAGTNNKEQASLTLPMLSKVVAFPTTIFIGKDGKVKKIHTGFSGPGTGIYYEQFIETFNETINSLLLEGQDRPTAKL